ncbi:molybdopterin-dependent oxidoreductase [Serratia odorifera]|uniref:Oxidoreductase molybdopterin binding domain protein n=2 Tax=Serratia odorifera TaxID=618 RepID=D4E0Y1_SEROD|nr:molybdopterin-dependent oxidoreductase [Serratia odorifera]EFE96584.1 oxidoreductase molybdopterin binding domain protein [Serratia odorifera DSM 4582]MBJ2066854.1 molybdopterin-dependent oxidoreductase [Serratia odorifera]PNK90938.1 oxidoreductase [Serratia odorifera]RII72241.1 oxidoreductase [Serratia odorifera]VDZ57506.1 Sulfoxide reductase catalytic subunit yedY precursor [Serratia odorifera]
MQRQNNPLGPSDGQALLKEAQRLLTQRLAGSSRRRFLRNGLTLGGIAMLTGCDISANSNVEQALSQISRFNDRVQGWLFNADHLAPVYAESMITRPFPFNAFYAEQEAPEIDGNDYRLEVAGLVQNRQPWTLTQLHSMAHISQVTRHICVEGWSAIGKWGGVPFAAFLQAIGADLGARYVSFTCADDYYTSIDMATALHPQTILALSYDGKTLPRKYGYPMKLRMPTKLGYKNPKHIQVIEITNRFPGGYWEDQGYNWFGGS